MCRDYPSFRRGPVKRSLTDSFVNSPIIPPSVDCSNPVQIVSSSGQLNNAISLYGEVSDLDLDLIDSVISSRKAPLPSDFISSHTPPKEPDRLDPPLTDTMCQ